MYKTAKITFLVQVDDQSKVVRIIEQTKIEFDQVDLVNEITDKAVPLYLN